MYAAKKPSCPQQLPTPTATVLIAQLKCSCVYKKLSRRELAALSGGATLPAGHRLGKRLLPSCKLATTLGKPQASLAKLPAVSAAVGKLSFALLSSYWTTLDACGPRPRPLAFEMCNSMMQCQTEDLKTSALLVLHAGIRGIGPTASRRRRWIPSKSSWCQNVFSRKENNMCTVVD